jgi:hypothetical protein
MLRLNDRHAMVLHVSGTGFAAQIRMLARKYLHLAAAGFELSENF